MSDQFHPTDAELAVRADEIDRRVRAFVAELVSAVA